ncbi:hypothetical protein KUTeg_019751 [Tegillarca granosa]|uniref:Uncharacterized protein n=1 Tax=Tegillarca granosa TaxID=220873 RepID=A0ABQ9EIL2_TEGGR|nr:hypothetical protein KUTeg_019751 [Tegillarca granosa]
MYIIIGKHFCYIYSIHCLFNFVNISCKFKFYIIIKVYYIPSTVLKITFSPKILVNFSKKIKVKNFSMYLLFLILDVNISVNKCYTKLIICLCLIFKN